MATGRARRWRRWLGVAALATACALPALAASPTVERAVSIHGARDGKVPAWTLTTRAPAGWTDDCCTYAAAIGVNFVLYQGDWTGDPQRVMVLNVWPATLPTLAAEIAADRKNYRRHDASAKVDDLAVRHAAMDCAGTVYRGSDKVDDVVVFCDPGAKSGIRLSWSLTFDDADPGRRALLDAFMRVVAGTRYHAGGA